MLKQLFYKLFGLEDAPCASCELLRVQLEKCDLERKELLNRLLNPIKEKEVPVDIKDLQPIVPQVIPWSVRKQMLEKEDRVKAEVLRKQAEEIKDSQTETIKNLEEELGVKNG